MTYRQRRLLLLERRSNYQLQPVGTNGKAQPNKSCAFLRELEFFHELLQLLAHLV
jgi:hypothetical protein